MGQGVYKSDNKINFIAKTLPGETGTARVLKSKKGVAFAALQELDIRASNRIEAECPHYSQCPGCDYLHTDYQSEITYKQLALDKLLSRFFPKEMPVEIISAPRRTAYRNRIQLHYKNSEIGLIDGLTNTLVEIPECKILREELKPMLKTLYQDRSWSETHKGSGHCELYLNRGEVTKSWNQPYAAGGFSQVFNEMNQALRESVARYLPPGQLCSLLDLFAGDGNLSDLIVNERNVHRVMVDYQFPETAVDSSKQNLLAIDLFDEEALKRFQRQCKIKQFDVLLVDPPRKGFLQLNTWIERFKTKYLVYVSCNPATLARDLDNLDGKFTLDHLMLLDLFPGTHHFETVAFLSLK